MSPRDWKRLIMRVFFYSILSVVVAALVFLAFTTYRMYQKDREVKERYEAAREHLSQLEVKKQSLTEELELLNEERGLDEAIREKYLLTRPGEEVIIIVDKSKAPDDGGDTARDGFWNSVKVWLGW